MIYISYILQNEEVLETMWREKSKYLNDTQSILFRESLDTIIYVVYGSSQRSNSKKESTSGTLRQGKGRDGFRWGLGVHSTVSATFYFLS